MKYLSLVVLFGLIAVVIGYLVVGSNREPRTDDHRGAIVRLTHDGRTFCTGTVVKNNMIITASHCVIIQTPFGTMMNDDVIEIRGNDNLPTGIIAKPFGARIQLDQAALTGDFRTFNTRNTMTDIKSLNKLQHENVTMWACGYPLGGPLYCTKMVFKDPYDFMWSVQGLLLPGMSGGPVVLEDGTVVAVNVAVQGDRSVVSPIYNFHYEFDPSRAKRSK